MLVGWHGHEVTGPRFSLNTLSVDVKPVGDQVFVNGNEWYLSTTTVDVLATAPFANKARFWLRGEEEPEFEDFTGGWSFATIPEGRTAAFAQFEDGCGFQSVPYQWFLILDTEGPIGGFIEIDSGAKYLDDLTVKVRLSATDTVGQVAQMRLSEAQDFTDAAWETFAGEKSWTFDETEGPKILYAQFRDPPGNESEITSDTILLDRTEPQDVSISIGGGGRVHNSNPGGSAFGGR